jgi:hypothetical protein
LKKYGITKAAILKTIGGFSIPIKKGSMAYTHHQKALIE